MISIKTAGDRAPARADRKKTAVCQEAQGVGEKGDQPGVDVSRNRNQGPEVGGNGRK